MWSVTLYAYKTGKKNYTTGKKKKEPLLFFFFYFCDTFEFSFFVLQYNQEPENNNK